MVEAKGLTDPDKFSYTARERERGGVFYSTDKSQLTETNKITN